MVDLLASLLCQFFFFNFEGNKEYYFKFELGHI